MKKIEAFIRPEKYKDVQRALRKEGCRSVTVIPVQGRGASGETKEAPRSGRGPLLAETWKVEIVCSDKVVHALLRAVAQSAWTGKTGDGKIFVSPIDQAVRIRTGESGEEVL